ncbi:short-wave-sensitive opsin 1-like [Saccostrea cucullata]|uniref:short-wave-sensitive opsin 1-like n=1 Tax=Saccostrea cuccullata TaxID=36930 RepID=UPI002ED38248
MTGNLSQTASDTMVIEQWLQYLYGAVYLLISIVSAIANGILIYIFFWEKTRNSFCILLLGLCTGDFFMSVFGTFTTALAFLIGRRIMSFHVCQIQGIIMTFLGLSQIVLLSAISFTRFVIMSYPNFRLHSCYAKGIVCGSYGYCLTLAICPILGWGSYLPNVTGTSCEPIWDSLALRDITFNIYMLMACLALPLILICFSYFMIFVKVKHQCISHDSRKIRVTNTLLIMIGLFILSWAPYTILSVFQMTRKRMALNPNLVSIPGVFAKLSALWNPGPLYTFTEKRNFAKCVENMFGVLNGCPAGLVIQVFPKEETTPSRGNVLFSLKQDDFNLKIKSCVQSYLTRYLLIKLIELREDVFKVNYSVLLGFNFLETHFFSCLTQALDSLIKKSISCMYYFFSIF